MATILLPTMAAFKGDLETMRALLQKTAGGHQIGLEVIGKDTHFSNEDDRNKMIANLNEVASGLPLVIHGFSGIQVYESGTSDMRTPKGKALLHNYRDLAEKVNAGYVHVHGGAGYRGSLPASERTEGIRQIRENLLSCKNGFKGNVGIEVLPTPSAGDLEKDPRLIWRDGVESIEDCLEVVKDTDLKVTLDTCHYATSRDGPIDLVAAAEQIGDHLGYVHVSDVLGFWKPHESVWQEGVVPGDGRIGKDAFKKFFKYLGKRHPNVGIEVEVYNKDFKNPRESEESIRRVVHWLD